MFLINHTRCIFLTFPGFMSAEFGLYAVGQVVLFFLGLRPRDGVQLRVRVRVTHSDRVRLGTYMFLVIILAKVT